jgi:hypothetical protein
MFWTYHELGSILLAIKMTINTLQLQIVMFNRMRARVRTPTSICEVLILR